MGTALTASDVQYKPTADIGTCSVAANTSRSTCVSPGVWTSATQGDITVCELDVDQFIIGATTNVSGIEKVWGINEEGKIKDASGTSITVGTVTCPLLSADWDASGTVMQ